MTCPFAPYARPHSYQFDVGHDEWVALLRRKCGLNDPVPEIESGRVENGWTPYQRLAIDEHQMVLEIRCPFCGKEFTVIIELPDWSRNIILSAIEQLNQAAPSPEWPSPSGLDTIGTDSGKEGTDRS